MNCRFIVSVLFASVELSACGVPSIAQPTAAPPTITTWPTPTAAPTITPSPTPAPRFQIKFDSPDDGASLAAKLDSHGAPIISVTVESRIGSMISLDANGETVANYINVKNQFPYTVTLNWWPHQTGPYTITLKAHKLDAERTIITAQTIHVNVTSVPTTPVLARMIELYKANLGLNLTAPALARFAGIQKNDGTTLYDARWISAAFIDDALYEIDLFDDGHATTNIRRVNAPVGNPVCRPAGRYRVLAVFVDYKNTGIAKEAALNALQKAVSERNGFYAQAVAQKTPILQLDVTGAFIAAPPKPGELLTLEQIKTLTGYDASQFDLLAQIDLDSSHAYDPYDQNKTGGHLEGLAIYGCTGTATKRVNLWVDIEGASYLDSDLQGRFLQHELAHIFGWQHWWPCGAGSTLEGENCAGELWPSLLFGWSDLKGDGVPEILAKNPYGKK